MRDLFIRKEMTYDLRAKYLLQLPKAKTVLNRLNQLVAEEVFVECSDILPSSQGFCGHVWYTFSYHSAPTRANAHCSVALYVIHL